MSFPGAEVRNPETPAPARPWWRRLWAAAGVAAAAALVGLGVGLVWRAVAPRTDIVRIAQGFVYAQAQPEQAVAADGWFTFLAVGAGLVLAVLAWLVLRRSRGWAVLAGLVLGSVVGGWLGWWVAVDLDRDRFEAAARGAEIGGHLDAPLMLGITDLEPDDLWPPRATGLVLVQALGAAIAYTTLAGFAADPRLRPGRAWLEELPAPSGWTGEAYGVPVRPEPAPTEFMRPEPRRSEPVPSEPVPSEPMRPESAASEPERPEPDPSSGPGGSASRTGWPAQP